MKTLIFGFCSGLALVIFGFIFYSITTNKIIKDQEQTIDELLRDNDRLRLEKKYLEKERAKREDTDTAITFKVLNQKGYKTNEDLFKVW